MDEAAETLLQPRPPKPQAPETGRGARLMSVFLDARATRASSEVSPATKTEQTHAARMPETGARIVSGVDARKTGSHGVARGRSRRGELSCWCSTYVVEAMEKNQGADTVGIIFVPPKLAEDAIIEAHRRRDPACSS